MVTVRVTDADGGSATRAVTVTVTNSGPTAADHDDTLTGDRQRAVGS